MRQSLSSVSLLFLSLGLWSCAHYRSGTGEYRGLGNYTTSSDYDIDGSRLKSHLPPTSQFKPKAEFALSWPVKNVHVNRGFQMASQPHHMGLDLGGKKGNLILASHEGVVVYTGSGFRGYGKMVLIEYDKQWATLYAHLNDIEVREGAIVVPGQVIGEMGRTGRATGVHLHFELMHNHNPVDPLRYLTQKENLLTHR